MQLSPRKGFLSDGAKLLELLSTEEEAAFSEKKSKLNLKYAC